MTDNSVVSSDLWYRYDMGWNALASYDLGSDGSTAWDIDARAQSRVLRQLRSNILKFGNERDTASVMMRKNLVTFLRPGAA